MEGFQKGDYPTELRFRYTNHEGVAEDRSLHNVTVAFGHSVYHPDIDFDHFLIGNDAVREMAVRHFPLSSILQPPADNGLIMGHPRSGRWSGVRRAHLALNPACKACGTLKVPNVHHIEPYHVNPDRELDPTNLVTLCETPSHNCHLIFGHLLDWKAFNPNVLFDSIDFYNMVKSRSYA